jgi:hypothetical protein
MRVSRAAITVCSLSIAACAAATSDPSAPSGPAQDCTDREGSCVQSGVVQTPSVDAKLDTALETGSIAAPRAIPSGYPFWVLQLNLCNSGLASCYDGGKSVPEAATAIQNSAPDVVTLNEICQPDVAQLSTALSALYAGDTVVWAFKAAGDRRTSAAYKCKNGQDYGIGLIVHVPGAYSGHTVFSGLYASQDTSSAEERAWVCIHATGSFYACTTHLASTSGTVALAQCKDLMTNLLPGIQRADGGAGPTVLGGDLNLKYKGSPDAQSCVPAGYFRKGDGDVQHIMATTTFAFSSSRTISMQHTDHPGWFVALTAP